MMIYNIPRFLLILIIFFWAFWIAGCGLVGKENSNPEAARINRQLGLLYLQQGQVEIAKSKLLLAYKQAPHDAEIHDALGIFYAQIGELSVAAKHYLFAIKLAGGKAPFWHHYGRFLYQQEHYQQALKYFLLAAKDFNYSATGEAYADAGKAAQKLQQKKRGQTAKSLPHYVFEWGAI